MPPIPPQPWQTEFARALAQLEQHDDRRTLAQLRRGLGKQFGESPERDGWVLRQLHAAESLSDASINHCCQIASLFALHPQSSPRGNLGSAFRRLNPPGAAAADQSISEGAVEQRFHALLDSDTEDLPARLRHAVSLLKSKQIAVDWCQLLVDLERWNWPSRLVQRSWSRAFWAPSSVPADSSLATQTPDVPAQ